MKYIIAVLAILFSFNAFAAIQSDDLNAAGFNKLSEAQKAKIVQDVQQTVQQDPNTTAEKVDQWVKIGTDIGQGLAGAAKELGVQANQFATTPVGKMTAFLIVYHFMGSDVLHMVFHIIGGMLIWVIGFSAVYNLMRQTQRTTYEYSDNGKVTSKTRYPISSDAASGWFFGYIAVLLIGVAVFVTF